MLLYIAAWALEAVGVDVRRRLWLARNQLFGQEAVGIWRADDRLGWRHIAGASGRQSSVPDYDVLYRIDAQGHRSISGGPAAHAPSVLFLGGSFTFGHGVEDDETYPAVLQRAWPALRVVNAATNAWGTAHALLALADELAASDDIALVVYGFITDHLRRNHRSAWWLKQLDETRERRNPFFEIDGDALVFRGLADPIRDALPDDRDQRVREVRMTERLLVEMARLCAARGIRLVVVQLPDATGGRAVDVLERSVGRDAVIDLASRLRYQDLRFKHDIHPTPAGHRAVAEALQPRLEPLLPVDSARPDAHPDPIEKLLPGGYSGSNVIFISVDTLRADHLGLYGYSRDTSPNLDRLAKEAVTFDRAQAPRGLTWPSLVSMLTSLYPKSSNVRRNGDLLSEEVLTLADILKGKGYATAAFFGNACGVIMRNLDTNFCGSDEEAHRDAIRWLKDRDESPFFFWVHYKAPHEEYAPPPVHDVFTRPDYRGEATGERTYLDAVTLAGKRPEQKDLDHVVALYDGEVRYADSMLGEVWKTLLREGILESSIVIFTSDHGEELLQHNNYFYHSCSIYESVLHIPLVIRFPDKSLNGVRIPELVGNIDITPTLLELLGVDLPNSFEGQTLLPLMNREPRAKEEFTRSFAEYYRPGTGWIGSIRTDRWHYIYNPEKITTACRPQGTYFGIDEEELYDHAKDTMEVRNLATLHTDLLADFRHEILEAFGRQREWGPPRRANPEIIEQLKAMGYLTE